MTATPTFHVGDSEQPLTADEWRLLESYHRRGYQVTWNQKDKITLASALRKCYGEGHPLPPSFLAKIRKWIEASPEAEE